MTEIAIDLEAHEHRSYQGFTCLIQISSRTQDFIIDSIALRAELGDHLRPVFTDPKKLKVLHGANSDVVWLQRDFSLYLVNMFDTGQAARVLQLPGFGLAFLLQKYCNVVADKKYQLADWRQRPLPAEMLKYAREDTHYLLYIYDCIRKDLITEAAKKTSNEVTLLEQVHKKSNVLCLTTWEKPLVKDFNYHMIIQRQRIHSTDA